MQTPYICINMTERVILKVFRLKVDFYKEVMGARVRKHAHNRFKNTGSLFFSDCQFVMAHFSTKAVIIVTLFKILSSFLACFFYRTQSGRPHRGYKGISLCFQYQLYTWNCNTSTIDHLQRIHLQPYYVDESVIEWLFPLQCCSGFYSPSRIICGSHILGCFSSGGTCCIFIP